MEGQKLMPTLGANAMQMQRKRIRGALALECHQRPFLSCMVREVKVGKCVASGFLLLTSYIIWDVPQDITEILLL